MKNIRTLLAPLLLTVLCGIALQAQGREQCYTLASPDGRLVSQIVVTDKGVMTYRMTFGDVSILQPSRIALCREIGGVVSDGIKVQKVYRQSVDEMVPSPLYRQAAMRDRYNGLTLKLKDGLWVDFRAYDEGLAYRFRNDRECVVRNETVEYRFAKDWTATVPYVRNFDENNHDAQFFSSFENTYITDTVSRLDPRRLAFLPLLVHADGGLKVCLTESNLEHYPGLYLKGDGEGHLVGEHAGYPDEVSQGGHNNLQELVKSRKGYVARLRKGDALPWRIAMVAADDRELAMNNMSYLLSEESRIEDMSPARLHGIGGTVGILAGSISRPASTTRPTNTISTLPLNTA